MCLVSNTGDYWGDRLPQKFPWVGPYITPRSTTDPIDWAKLLGGNSPNKEEFDKLKNEVEIMKDLLIRAKIYDEQHNQPNCEIEDKIAKLKAIAAIVGISLDDIFIGDKRNIKDLVPQIEIERGPDAIGGK